MLTSLRSRLLLSYFAVIATMLVLVGLALLAVSLSSSARILPTLRQLATISSSVRRELAQRTEQAANPTAISQVLDEAAVELDARIVLYNRSNDQVIYDSEGNPAALEDIRLDEVQRPDEFSAVDPSLPIGRLRLANGERWLIYSQPLASRGPNRLLLIVARPEPAVIQIFRTTFLRPLCQAGLVAFLLAVFLAFFISRSVARPLQDMATAAESIAEGEYEQQLSLVGPDEVRRVAGSFNTMAARVAASQQSQRDFVANVSHDLKTPLTSIRGWSQALLDGTAARPEQQQQAAGIIHGEATRMERLVNQLLDLARIESGQLQLNWETIDLAELLAGIHQNLALRAQEKGVHFTLDLQPVRPVSGDHDRLVQIFTNLADNALGHTSAGGRVHLALQPYGEKAVEVLVQDTGPGIAAEEISRIFERFYQVDKARVRSESGGGSGLGLAIVRELVEAHQGRISARSEPGKGSAFFVRLPAGEPEGTTITQRRTAS